MRMNPNALVGKDRFAEGANAMLNCGFVNIGHKFFPRVRPDEDDLLLAFTVVGYNLDRIRSFFAKRRRRRPGRRRRNVGLAEDRDGHSLLDPGGTVCAPATIGATRSPPSNQARW